MTFATILKTNQKCSSLYRNKEKWDGWTEHSTRIRPQMQQCEENERAASFLKRGGANLHIACSIICGCVTFAFWYISVPKCSQIYYCINAKRFIWLLINCFPDCVVILSPSSTHCFVFRMSLYPSLEDLKVDKVIRVSCGPGSARFAHAVC